MKKILLFLPYLLALGAQSQVDTTANAITTASSFSSLKRADIQRLPAMNLLDALQGAFPFIVKASKLEEDYSFLINGSVTTNPNVISLSQIETVSYFPAGTLLSRGRFMKKGTFVITTRSPGNSSLTVSTKTGVVRPLNSTDNGTTLTRGLNKGLFSLNDLNYRMGNSKGYFSTAASFLTHKLPEYEMTTASLRSSSADKLERWQFSSLGGYQVSDQWAFDAGFLFTSQPFYNRVQSGSRNSSLPYSSDGNTEKKTSYVAAQAAIGWQPAASFHNRISAEWNRYNDNSAGYTSGTTNLGNFEVISDNLNKNNVLSISNFLQWQVVVPLRFSLHARYYRYSISSKFYEKAVDGININQRGGTSNENARNYLITPNVDLNVKNVIFVEAGVSYSDYGPSVVQNKNGKQWLPHAGLRLELSPLLKNKAVSSLELSSQYSRFITTYERLDRLENERKDPPLPPMFLFNGLNDRNSYQPGYSFINSAALAFADNRFGIKVSHLQQDKYLRVLVPAPYGGNMTTYVMVYNKVNRKGMGLELKADIFSKSDKRWTVYGSLSKDKLEREGGYSQALYYMDENPYSSTNGIWSGGLRTAVSLSHWFFQGSILFAFDELPPYSYYPNDKNTYKTNYLLAGYKLPLKFTVIKQIEASVQVRELLQYEVQPTEKYIGGGLSVMF